MDGGSDLAFTKASHGTKNDVFIKSLDLDPTTEEKIRNSDTG